MRRLASWPVSGPASWKRGRLSCLTRGVFDFEFEEEQVTPRQSHGAEGEEGSQLWRAPNGSWRLSLKEVRAWISSRVWLVVWVEKGVEMISSSSSRKRSGRRVVAMERKEKLEVLIIIGVVLFSGFCFVRKGSVC